MFEIKLIDLILRQISSGFVTTESCPPWLNDYLQGNVKHDAIATKPPRVETPKPRTSSEPELDSMMTDQGIQAPTVDPLIVLTKSDEDSSNSNDLADTSASFKHKQELTKVKSAVPLPRHLDAEATKNDSRPENVQINTIVNIILKKNLSEAIEMLSEADVALRKLILEAMPADSPSRVAIELCLLTSPKPKLRPWPQEKTDRSLDQLSVAPQRMGTRSIILAGKVNRQESDRFSVYLHNIQAAMMSQDQMESSLGGKRENNDMDHWNG